MRHLIPILLTVFSSGSISLYVTNLRPYWPHPTQMFSLPCSVPDTPLQATLLLWYFSHSLGLWHPVPACPSGWDSFSLKIWYPNQGLPCSALPNKLNCFGRGGKGSKERRRREREWEQEEEEAASLSPLFYFSASPLKSLPCFVFLAYVTGIFYLHLILCFYEIESLCFSATVFLCSCFFLLKFYSNCV